VETEKNSTHFPNSITKEAINKLPIKRYDGLIRLINNDKDTEAAVETLSLESVLGFDTESRPTFHKGESYPPSLVQLAGSKEVYLFQIGQLESLKPLKRLLTNPDVLKVGVAIHDDIKKLQELTPFDPKGFIELSSLTQRCGIINTGLRNLAGIMLNFRVSKGSQVTNWARQQLTKPQIIYAATDAWVSLQIYLRLAELNLATQDGTNP